MLMSLYRFVTSTYTPAIIGLLGWIGKTLYLIASNHLAHIQASLDRIEALTRETHDNTIEIKAKVG